MLKRFITSLFCLFLILVSISFIGDTSFLCVPVYADSGSGSVGADWNQVTTNDQMVQSFLAYCKSRDSQILGGTANVVANVTYSYMQQLSKTVGIDLNELQSELYYKQETNKPLQWFMTSTGVTAYNHLFAQLISEKGFEVGDSADAVLKSGEWFEDDDGNGCFVYHFGSYQAGNVVHAPTEVGTTYCYTGEQLYNTFPTPTAPGQGSTKTIDFHIMNKTYPVSVELSGYNSGRPYYRVNVRHGGASGYVSGSCDIYDNNSDVNTGTLLIGRYSNQTNLYLVGKFYWTNRFQPIYVLTGASDTTQNVTVSFVSNNIKQEYEGDTYITNEGDVITNNTPGGQDPGWNVGGGQGSYSDGNGNSYSINFPDFELPDLNIDWSISGLGNKFPFSIPFDIVSLVTVLNAEPEAPRFEGTVNFGFTTWDYDINLEQFDTVAQVCRIAELLLLVFGLILITRSIIKG